ncbi:MAG: helicase associated domain-containing protein [Clostridium sp.]|nr:helicase associated domain-containing protein [Clostridium sp.]MCM1400238.1 helicase associated domain-containing protein [Clostridium sp.]MCM1460951.1 helicase associated domain-containing protein [Bacteroides sp.]
MEKITIDEVIQDCNNICLNYELASELSKEPIENQKDYIKHYKIIEWLQELKEYKDTGLTPANFNEIVEWLQELKAYKDTGLTPEKIREMDKLYAGKCAEVNELQKSQVKYLGENIAIDCRVGQCKCGNIVRSYQKFCDECGTKLDWSQCRA